MNTSAYHSQAQRALAFRLLVSLLQELDGAVGVVPPFLDSRAVKAS